MDQAFVVWREVGDLSDRLVFDESAVEVDFQVAHWDWEEAGYLPMLVGVVEPPDVKEGLAVSSKGTSTMHQQLSRRAGGESDRDGCTLQTMPLSDYARDTWVATDMSHFTRADLLNMSQADSQQEHWVANFILNAGLRSNPPASTRHQLYNFLRRCISAFHAYEQARQATYAYLAIKQRILPYLDALEQWEAFLAYAYQAYNFLAGGKPILFRSRDDSILDRLNSLYNSSRYPTVAVESCDSIDTRPVTVWLTNEGLRSAEAILLFSEVVEILQELAVWADAASDPATMRDKIEARRRSGEATE